MSDYVEKGIEKISKDIRNIISGRYHTITRAVNREIRNIDRDEKNSLYVGSYGRNTAITTSDIDVLVELPEAEYERYDLAKGNGQSRLLQSVKEAISRVYPRTDIKADGQVIVLEFSDDIKFEVLPAFVQTDFWGEEKYLYPDTNMGGNWKSTNPRAEQAAMANKNKSSYGLLRDTCKHIRSIRDNCFSSYHLSGIVIDSFVYEAIGNWRWTPPESTGSSSEYGTYEKALYNYWVNNRWAPLYTPGSGQIVETRGSYEVLEKILRRMAE
jgi:predicted nucleotidyltransferase